MEHITYILGAGFSAPAGLPVMSNFLLKSKDMYFADPDAYNYFSKIFSRIDGLSKIKNFTNLDLFNIEDILSVFEMERLVTQKRHTSKEFIQFISDVVRYHSFTEDAVKPSLPGNWHNFIFGNPKNIARKYAAFVACLFNASFSLVKDSGPRRLITHSFRDNTAYSVITLNYDLILETIISAFHEFHNSDPKMGFLRERYDPDWKQPHLCKLHGSIDYGNIVPPTWAKQASDTIRKTWKNAYMVLKNSTQLRFIGYSLPVTDNYVKFLLQSALLESSHLKAVDVINIDPDGSVRKRYDDFFAFKYYRFVNKTTESYFDSVIKRHFGDTSTSTESIPFTQLEEIHEKFIQGAITA